MARIAVLSDAHLLMQAKRFPDESDKSPGGKESLINLTKVVDQVLEDRPDVVIMAGDMFDEKEKGGDWVVDAEAAKYWPDIRNEVRRLIDSTRHGVYSLRGNHDSAPVLRELQDYFRDGFCFARNEAKAIGDHKIYFMETHYRQGNYVIADEQLPQGGEVLIMHETLPVGPIPGLQEEVLQELCRRFGLVLNGHMHFYASGLLGMSNLYSLPALIPSRELKNNYMLEYRWPGGLDDPRQKDSPFGYVIIDGPEVSFQRYTPVQTIVNVRVEGEGPEEVIAGINEVYSRLMERPDKENLRIWVSAKGVTFKHTVREGAEKYPEIETIEILVESKRVSKKPAELKGLDKVMSIADLKEKVLTTLSGPDNELAQALFEEVLTDQYLSKRMDSNQTRYLFRELLSRAAPLYGVPGERLGRFFTTIESLWKIR